MQVVVFLPDSRQQMLQSAVCKSMILRMISSFRIVCLCLLLILNAQLVYSQSGWEETDRRIMSMQANRVESIGELGWLINQNFSDDAQKLRAMYVWLAHNIRYDTREMDELTREETDAEITVRTFELRKGICEGYAGIMDSLCKLAGITSHIVSGYTRQEEQIDPLPHAWIAAKVNDYWYLSDPTWGAGSVLNNRFRKEFDERYFMVPPSTMIRTHMPYDFIWQFLRFPVSHSDFEKGTTSSAEKNVMIAFEDSIQQHLSLSRAEQLANELRRINSSVEDNKALDIRKQYLNQAISVDVLNKGIRLFNEATATYNMGAEKYNDYATFRNKHSNHKPYTNQLKSMLDESRQYFLKVSDLLSSIEVSHPDLKRNISVLNRNASNMLRRIEQEYRQL
jgi:hypothetical protein